MRIVGKAVVTETYTSEKSGNTYYTLADLEMGGTASISVPYELDGVDPGTMVTFDIEVRPRIMRGGGVSLGYVSGKIGVLAKS
jgi:hypothetical protein